MNHDLKAKKKMKNDIEFNLKTMISSDEEFKEKVEQGIINEGTIFYSIETYCGKPRNVREFEVEKLKKCEDNDSLISSYYEVYGEHQKEFSADFFWGCKCIFLDEEEAKKAYNHLIKEYSENKEWQEEVESEKLSLSGNRALSGNRVDYTIYFNTSHDSSTYNFYSIGYDVTV